MENSVSSIDDLRGWRCTEGEELRYLQGVLLEWAKAECATERKVNIILLIVIFAMCVLMRELANSLVIALELHELKKGIASVVMLVIAIVAIVACMKALWKNIVEKSGKRYHDWVKNNEFRVVDVNIEAEVTRVRSTHHFVRISDLFGSIYSKQVKIIFYQECVQPGLGIMVDFSHNSVDAQVVVASYKMDNRLLDRAMKLYKKNMK